MVEDAWMTFGADWYPVALSQGLLAGTSAGAKVFGAELVVWRAGDGGAHVWEDRCPHRGMRLSFGFVRENHIACLYHGWQYDVEGRCRFIPAHPRLDVPDTIRVPRYPAQEAFGMVWAYAAPNGAVPNGAVPNGAVPNGAVPNGAAPNGAVPKTAAPPAPGVFPDHEVVAVRSLYLDCPAEAVLAHLLAFEATASKVEALALVRLDVEGSHVHGGLQPIDTARSALHLVAEPGADRRAIALWSEDLRRAVEAAAVETATEALS